MQRKSWGKFDLWLLASALALVCYGFIVLRSATMLADQPVSRQLLTQAVYAALGVGVMFGVAALDYRMVGALAIPIYGVALATLALVLVVGKVTYGAQRWIMIGPFSLQPSELTKVAVIVCLARYLASREDEGRSLKAVLISLAIVAVPAALVYRQPDLGTTLVLMAIWFGMVFVAGAPLKWLGSVVAVPFVAFPLIWRMMHDYMRRRLTIFLSPERDPFGEGYNVIQARISVGSGGWWGKGLGNGTQTQLNFLKVQHSDFIFAVLAEELGFVGGLALLGLFGGLFWRCVRVGQRSRDAFGRLLAAGTVSMLLFQVFINIGMNIGLAPVTGIPLPFISAGGSSLLAIFGCLGLLQSVLLHSQARRYDTQPSVTVPASVRIRRERFPLRWVVGRVGRSVAARRPARLPRG
ncbi:MAG TPA: rod shape-determining protein RodA [Chloroflexota bacterium]|nr:rod shape-determining protein RodA [Chloroflexota bacterium]